MVRFFLKRDSTLSLRITDRSDGIRDSHLSVIGQFVDHIVALAVCIGRGNGHVIQGSDNLHVGDCSTVGIAQVAFHHASGFTMTLSHIRRLGMRTLAVDSGEHFVLIGENRRNGSILIGQFGDVVSNGVPLVLAFLSTPDLEEVDHAAIGFPCDEDAALEGLGLNMLAHLAGGLEIESFVGSIDISFCRDRVVGLFCRQYRHDARPSFGDSPASPKFFELFIHALGQLLTLMLQSGSGGVEAILEFFGTIVVVVAFVVEVISFTDFPTFLGSIHTSIELGVARFSVESAPYMSFGDRPGEEAIVVLHINRVVAECRSLIIIIPLIIPFTREIDLYNTVVDLSVINGLCESGRMHSRVGTGNHEIGDGAMVTLTYQRISGVDGDGISISLNCSGERCIVIHPERSEILWQRDI